MVTFRIMNYNINGAHNASGELEPELCAAVIRAQQPDIVMLQKIGSPIGLSSVDKLADRVGLAHFGPDCEGACSYLSRYPLNHLQELSLGHGGQCIQADLDLEGERIHLFNLALAWDYHSRSDQVALLLKNQLLDNPNLPCATIICGDFGLPWWGSGQIPLRQHLRRARFPVWRANFPGKIPLWGRDRIYFRGPIHALAGSVIMSAEARQASTHLPIVLTVEMKETREYLKIKESSLLTRKQTNPVCG